jgi:NADPH-dependent F420 reductase
VRAGSRDRSRAEAVVAEVRDQWGDRVATLDGVANEDAAKASDLVVVATTWEAAVATAADHAADLAGKPVISMANGLERVGREFNPVFPEAGSVSQAVQNVVPAARVVAAFHLVPAAALAQLDEPLQSDVVVCGTDDDARRLVLDLIVGIPDLRAFDAGSLVNSVGIEAFAALLLTVNLRHKGKGTLRLLGLDGYVPSA